MPRSTAKNLRIEDIAAACGVSSATVSNVLNNRARTATSETRERVLSMVRQMNYRPRALASGQRAVSSNTIGVVMSQPYLSDTEGMSYLNGLVAGILPVVIEERYFVTLYGGFDWPDTHEALRVYCDGRCDGMIVITPPNDSEFLNVLHSRGIPFVTLTEVHGQMPISFVDSDNERGVRDVVAYLHGLGHRRIAYFEGSVEVSTSRFRHDGYLKGLSDVGLPLDPTLIYPGEYSYDSGHERASRLCEEAAAGNSRLPTAIFCANDSSAFGAVSALQAHGIRVPEDISVVGFDDIPAAAEWNPPLTTVRQPLLQMGAEAVRLLLARLRGGATDDPAQVRLPTQLIVRGTTAKPPE